MNIIKNKDGLLVCPDPGEEITDIKTRKPYGQIFYLNIRYKLNLPNELYEDVKQTNKEDVI